MSSCESEFLGFINNDMKYIVYLITRNDGQKYIGTTNTDRLHKRMIQHKCSKRFHNQTFGYKIIYETIDILDCYDKEEYYIGLYNTYHNGLNESLNGRGKNKSIKFTTLGYKFSDHSKSKMSKTRKDRIASGNIMVWNEGKFWSDEMKEHFSKIRKGIRHSSKLNIDIVKEIRNKFESEEDLEGVGEVQRNGRPLSYVQAFSKKYAPIYGVTDAAIKKIVLYQTWNNHVRDCKTK